MTPSDRAGTLAVILMIVIGALALFAMPTVAGANDLCADLNGDEMVTGADLSLVAGDLGLAVPPADEWLDLSPDLAITGADLSLVAKVVGRACWLHGGPDVQAGESVSSAHSCPCLRCVS